jgi:uncharacterized protein YndB with AHSA1/START domain
MPAKSHTLSFSRTIRASPEEVYRALTNPTALRDWLCHAAQAEPRPGGRLYLWWDEAVYAAGQFTSLAPGRSVTFDWQHSREPEAARIQITLKPSAGISVPAGSGRDASTAVRLRHRVGAGKKWAAAMEAAASEWPEALENLQSVIETGVDLRYARRPLLGIAIDETSADAPAKPAREGLRLAGVADGFGAQAAGLQKGDVLVKFSGKKIANYAGLARVLEAHQAGDTVEVVFYRGDEKHTTKMKLSQRPMPTVPQTAEALAAASHKIYADLNAAIAGFVEGVTEAEAERRPSPGEWTVKELLAHYVAMERDLQSWAAELLNGGNNIGEAQDSLEFRPNVTVRLDALVARYPSVPQLLEELKRSQDETLALLAALPPELVARKHLYYRLAAWMMETVPGHIDEHREQFAATIAAARKN